MKMDKVAGSGNDEFYGLIFSSHMNLKLCI